MADAVADALDVRPAPAGPGRHRHRQVARLPRSGPDPAGSSSPDERIVVATATLALQTQLANNDIPAALDAVEAITGRAAAARHPQGPDQLRLPAAGPRQHRAGPGRTDLGRRPGRHDRISAAELARVGAGCGGAGAAGVGRGTGRRPGPGRSRRRPVAHRPGLASGVRSRCASASGRNAARTATSASSSGRATTPGPPTSWSPTTRCWRSTRCTAAPPCPNTSAVIIDEAHELVARVTGAASAELSPQQVERVGKRALTYLEDERGAGAAGVGRRPADRPGRDAAGADRRSGVGVRRRLRHGPERGACGGQRDDRRRGEDRRRTSGRPPPRSRRSSTSPSGWLR